MCDHALDLNNHLQRPHLHHIPSHPSCSPTAKDEQRRNPKSHKWRGTRSSNTLTASTCPCVRRVPFSRPTLTDAFVHSYDIPPLDDITLEEFETCALNRLRILAEIESSFARNRTYEEMKTVTLAQCEKYLPLHSSTASSIELDLERRRDHVGHFVLRLAFCRS